MRTDLPSLLPSPRRVHPLRARRPFRAGRLAISALLYSLLTGPALASGDVLQIPLSQQGDSKLPRPGKGMSKSEVEALFGAPQQSQGPVGTPPITRWQYADYVVIFEYDHVVHTVLKHKPVLPQTVTPASEPPANDSAADAIRTEQTRVVPEPAAIPQP